MRLTAALVPLSPCSARSPINPARQTGQSDGLLSMALQDLVGCVAAILVFATFSAKRMVLLRMIGVASNIAFVAYASMAGLWPILLLHSILLPLNAVRLRQAILWRANAETASKSGDQQITSAANDNEETPVREIAISVGNLALKRPTEFTCRHLEHGATRRAGIAHPSTNSRKTVDHWSPGNTRTWREVVTDIHRYDVVPWLSF
jgi:hypothetical protein